MTKKSEALELAELHMKIASGEALRVRVNSGTPRSAVSRDCLVSESTVSRWERGLQAPRGPAAVRYARLLGRLEALQQKRAS